MSGTISNAPTFELQGSQKKKELNLLQGRPRKRRPQKQYIKKIMKRQRNTAERKEQTRNTEVQIMKRK